MITNKVLSMRTSSDKPVDDVIILLEARRVERLERHCTGDDHGWDHSVCVNAISFNIPRYATSYYSPSIT